MWWKARAARSSAVLLVSIAVFAFAGYGGGRALIDHQNRVELSNLSGFVLHRAELEVDFAVTALGDLIAAGAASCDDAGLTQMRREVYVRSTVKDIRVVDAAGAVLCEAFPEALAFDAGSVDHPATLPAKNKSVALFRLSQANSDAIGVLWRVQPMLSVVAVLNTDAILYEALPQGVRDASNMTMTLSNGDRVASYQSSSVHAAEHFSASSERYPLTLDLAVDRAALATWNSDTLPVIAEVAALVGLGFGLLLARIVSPPRGLLAELDDAMALGEIVAYFQPVFSVATGAIVGCEALARWVRPDGSVVQPNNFVPLVEQSGRIGVFTWTIVRSALRSLGGYLRSNPSFTVAFNIAPRHFLQTAFADDLREVVAQSGVSPKQVVLELAERQELADLALGAETIASLRADGFAFALDDAGTGHSGLTYVQALGAQIIKIDKFFVDAIETSNSARLIVQMLVGVAHELGMRVVAEGIETSSQLQLLRDFGVEDGQGYLVSAPLPAEAFSRLVEPERTRGAKALRLQPRPDSAR